MKDMRGGADAREMMILLPGFLVAAGAGIGIIAWLTHAYPGEDFPWWVVPAGIVGVLLMMGGGFFSLMGAFKLANIRRRASRDS